MRKIKVRASFGPLFLSMCVVAVLLIPMAFTQPLPAQTQTAPVAGTSVVVRMMDAVNSTNDPAGKQYRASVTKAVDAGNGVTIPQGAVAAVTLTKSGSGYAAQSAAGSAVSAVSSIRGEFGHHVSAPTGVSAVAVGQRVVLPP